MSSINLLLGLGCLDLLLRIVRVSISTALTVVLLTLPSSFCCRVCGVAEGVELSTEGAAFRASLYLSLLLVSLLLVVSLLSAVSLLLVSLLLVVAWLLVSLLVVVSWLLVSLL
jgi:hypothetical protein